MRSLMRRPWCKCEERNEPPLELLQVMAGVDQKNQLRNASTRETEHLNTTVHYSQPNLQVFLCDSTMC